MAIACGLIDFLHELEFYCTNNEYNEYKTTETDILINRMSVCPLRLHNECVKSANV